MSEQRLIDIEMCLAEQERTLDDLNAEVLRLTKLVQELARQVENLKAGGTESLVKPLSEETPPPHY